MQDLYKELEMLVREQEAVLTGYKKALQEYEGQDAFKEYEKLQEEYVALQKDYTKLQQEHSELMTQYKSMKEEVLGLKYTLNQQYINEKLELVNKSKRRLEAYFVSAYNENTNRLKSVEEGALGRLSAIRHMTQQIVLQDEGELLDKIKALETEVMQRNYTYKTQLSQNMTALHNETYEHLDKLVEEPLTEEMIRKRQRQNNIEVKIGLSWINKIGILLTLIGVLTFFQFAYTHFFTPQIKGISGMLLGIAFLAGGIYCYHKEKKTFGTGLTGGGIAILYIAIFMSYFNLQIIGLILAISLCVLISCVAFTLSVRYHSKTIGIFALVGGYMPLISLGILNGIEEPYVLLCMLYVFILHGVTLAIGLKKDWPLLTYVSFIINVPALLILIVVANHIYLSLTFTLLTFIVYLVSILAYPFIHDEKLRMGQAILIGFNTVISCVILYVLIEGTMLSSFKGFIAILFCIVYIGLYKLVDTYLKEEKTTGAIFFITALTFSVLIIPFQFGGAWFSLGWIIEGIGLSLYGIYAKSKRLEYSGNIIFAMSVGAFYLVDPFFKYYTLKFSVIMIGLILILVCYLREELLGGPSGKKQIVLRVYKYFVLINCVFYSSYILLKIGGKVREMGFFEWSLAFGTGLMIISLVLLKVKILQDKISNGIVLGSSIVTAFIYGGLNYSDYMIMGEGSFFYILLILLLNGLLLGLLSMVLKMWREKDIRIQVTGPILLICYGLFNTTGILQCFLNIPFETMSMSIYYVVIAFLCIGYGFKKPLASVRYLGLVLSILATGKLFIFDLHDLEHPIFRILSYFAFGIILIAISYMYQHFSKQLETQVTKKEGNE